MVMGAAEIVPGVSGGTIAFVTGIYERFINALKRFNPALIGDLRTHGLKQTWIMVDGSFLLYLFSGMFASILLFASGVSYLLHEQPIFIWSFFFGLVLASVWVVMKQVSNFDAGLAFIVLTGGMIGAALSFVAPIQLEPTSLYIFAGGVVAVCAWVLPGLSGSFILLILGLYGFVIEAVKTLDITFLMTLGAGCFVGIVSFAQILSRLFKHFRNETLTLLTGFMLGSLVKLWPWQQITSYQMNPDGSHTPLMQEPVLPLSYTALTGENPEMMIAMMGLVLGCLCVLGLNLLGQIGRGSIVESSRG